MQRPETHPASALHQRRPIRRIREDEGATNGWSGDTASFERSPPEARRVDVGVFAFGEELSHPSAGLLRAVLAHLALELDVHAHLPAAEIEPLLKGELVVCLWPVVRDQEAAVVGKPYVRLDLVTSEGLRLLERLDRVVWRVPLRSSVSDPAHLRLASHIAATHYDERNDRAGRPDRDEGRDAAPVVLWHRRPVQRIERDVVHPIGPLEERPELLPEVADHGDGAEDGNRDARAPADEGVADAREGVRDGKHRRGRKNEAAAGQADPGR